MQMQNNGILLNSVQLTVKGKFKVISVNNPDFLYTGVVWLYGYEG